MLSNKLKELREAHNMSIKDLANQIGVNAKTIKSWESGKTIPRLNYLVSIVKLFNIKLRDIDM